ncbi:MAG: hypothetical protein WCQ21_20235 [Verrucomicrobiota bacterium]|jgi:hypothetical protein
MSARELVVAMAGERFGRRPPGIIRAARVVELAPDPGAPEVLFMVEPPNWAQAGGSTMAVFEWEEGRPR